MQEIDICKDIHTFEHTVNELIEATYRDALEAIVEVVVIMDEAHRQTLNDKSGKLGAFTPPLLLGIAFNKDLVDVLTYQQLGLFLQIAGLRHAIGLHFLESLLTLFIDLGSGLLWCQNTPHLIEGVHIEGQVILPTLVIGDRRIGVAIELDNRIHKIPNLFIRGMEDMGTIFMDIDALDVLAIDIAAKMRTLVDDKAALPPAMSHTGESGTIDASSNNQMVVRFIHLFTDFSAKLSKNLELYKIIRTFVVINHVI